MNRVPPILLLLVVSACNAPEQPADARTELLDVANTASTVTPVQLAVMQAIADIDAMRSNLAGGISEMEEVEQETFAQVC
ncbi:MAG: hypothetical protein HKN37_05745, partial [Rhodothermales bacterium]|nr:hypothetical protein [Rhodothermales bacterium]